MSRTITLKLSDQTPESVVTKARTLAGRHGFHFTGSDEKGHFKGKGVEGRYHFEQDTLFITVFKKPLLIPWTTLESAVTAMFV